MCKVVINSPEQNKEYIIYNHLFSRPNYRFTLKQLITELKNYRLNLSDEYIEEEISNLITKGIVKENFNDYSVCHR